MGVFQDCLGCGRTVTGPIGSMCSECREKDRLATERVRLDSKNAELASLLQKANVERDTLRAENAALKAETEKLRELFNKPYPIQGGPSVPWYIMLPHERRSKRNHDQSIRRIAQRGGFGAAEAFCIVNNLGWHEATKRYTAEEMERRWAEFAKDVYARAALNKGAEDDGD